MKHDKGMNGKGITANGEKALDGQTIAADSSIPFGTQIYIPELGKTFTVTDRGGGITGDRLDIVPSLLGTRVAAAPLTYFIFF